MANNIFTTPIFESRFKRYSKKFPSLDEEILDLEETLIRNPESGIPLGADLYKIRLASKSKGKGKSGGFRIITYLQYETEDSTDIYLITIFDKSEESSIDKAHLVKIVKKIFP
jgi:hypothetical protein